MSEKKSRPRKRKTLAQYISSIFQKKISQPDIEGIIEDSFGEEDDLGELTPSPITFENSAGLAFLNLWICAETVNSAMLNTRSS